MGAIGQSLGEAVFLGYSTLLGKQAPFDNLRFYRQTTKGRSIIDIKKLDQKLGREATEKEINAAVKRGDIEVHQYKAIPSQSALNRKIIVDYKQFPNKFWVTKENYKLNLIYLPN